MPLDTRSATELWAEVEEALARVRDAHEMEALVRRFTPERERHFSWASHPDLPARLAVAFATHPLRDDRVLWTLLAGTGLRGYPNALVAITPHAPHIWQWEEVREHARHYIFVPSEAVLEEDECALARFLLEAQQGEDFRRDFEKLNTWFPEDAARILSRMEPHPARPVYARDLAETLEDSHEEVRQWAIRATRHLVPEPQAEVERRAALEEPA